MSAMRVKSVFMPSVVLAFIGSAAIAATPPGDNPSTSRSLPTDTLPPIGMLDANGQLVPLPDPEALHKMLASAPPAAPVKPTPGPSVDIAIAGARAALAACAAKGTPVAVAVVDAAGRPRALLMPNGTDGSVFVAMRKAVATLAFDAPSSAIEAMLKKDPALHGKLNPTMFIAGGALPIRHEGELVGAIATSGARGEGAIGHADEVCAEVGLQMIEAELAEGAHR
jgi:uncharacterized protein GlcG (DUF336 family)